MGYPEQSPESGHDPEFVTTRQGIAMTSSLYLGIDVSKSHLDLASSTKYLKRYDNTPAGHQALLKWLRKNPCQAIGLEATGCYSTAIAELLAAQDYTVFVVQPGRVRSYAHSQGLRAKTDRIDGQLIAQFVASSNKLHPFTAPSE